tara:strand:- start:31 stop:627 length:597 start_codon:yes stop_codon:yes gene_type:complete
MANKKRRCSQCKDYKIADDGIVINGTFFCDIDCATTKAFAGKDKGKKIAERNNKAAVIELDRKSLKWQHKQTQPVFNKLRRLQELKWFSDRGLEPVCISCEKPLGNDQWCNGHFKSVGANGRLRYDFKNSYLQHNNNCNNHKSGDATQYKIGLIDRFGEEVGREIISYCEENNSPIKRTWQELEAMRKEFNKQIKMLE